MAEVRAEQAESIERREQLLQELDMANQLTKREIAKQEEDKVARKLELEAQVMTGKENWIEMNQISTLVGGASDSSKLVGNETLYQSSVVKNGRNKMKHAGII